MIGAMFCAFAVFVWTFAIVCGFGTLRLIGFTRTNVAVVAIYNSSIALFASLILLVIWML